VKRIELKAQQNELYKLSENYKSVLNSGINVMIKPLKTRYFALFKRKIVKTDTK
jgi:hypothetical protein